MKEGSENFSQTQPPLRMNLGSVFLAQCKPASAAAGITMNVGDGVEQT